VELKPAAVTPELASAALASPALTGAVKLAEWVGEGREITESGVLRPAVAEQACKDLGFEREEPGKKLRSAQDVPALMVCWNVARLSGLITLEQKRAKGTAAAPDDPDATLNAWLRAVSAVFGLPDEPCAECLTVLAAIAQADKADLKLADVLEAVLQDSPATCPDCGGFHEDDHAMATAQHAASSVEDLMFFGALTVEGNGDTNSIITLSPLGQMLADSVFALLAPAPEDSAAAVATRLADLPGATAARYAAAWLAARTPVEAVAELLDAAKSATPRQRLSAIDLAAVIGPQAAPVWRERAEAPGYGAHIRACLAQWDGDVPNFPRDDAWLATDDLSAAYEDVPQDEAVVRMRMELQEAHHPYAATDMLEWLGESGHPDAPRLMDLVRTANNPRRPSTQEPDTTKPLQLLITLQNVDDPPVWRRIAVPGSTSLDSLHYMIQDAMGWENDHLYAFYAGRRELHKATPLRDVLPRSGSHFQYLYDFGDDWAHDVKSEGFYQNDKGVTLPTCLDGSGACPPEDSGGAYGYYYLKEALADPAHDNHYERLDWMGLDSAADFDPAAFSLESANKRLARPLPEETADPPGPPVITIVRAQRRGKKPKAKR